jgi:hypothetical protein
MSSDRDDVETERVTSRRALPVFNGRGASFPVWKARVRAWLQASTPSLLYVLEESVISEAQEVQTASSSSSSSSVVGPTSGSNVIQKGKKKDGKQVEVDRLKVYSMLITSLDDAHVGMIVTEVVEGDAMGIWKILLRKYERNTLASRNQLRRELHSLKLGVSESVDEYKSQTMHIVGRLRSSKEIVSDGEILYCMLEGLPMGYAMVKQAMEVQDVIDIEVACGHLREVEDKIRRAVDLANSGSEVASEASNESKVNKMGVERSRNNFSRKCLVCGRDGHTAYACSKRCCDGCYRCGGEHRVWECDKDYVESGDSEFEDGSFDHRGRRVERRNRSQTPENGRRQRMDGGK